SDGQSLLPEPTTSAPLDLRLPQRVRRNSKRGHSPTLASGLQTGYSAGLRNRILCPPFMKPDLLTDVSPPLHVPPCAPATGGQEIARLRDLSRDQWTSGLAAWLGWLFDGLDMHLYTLVATPFVAVLLAVDQKDPSVATYSSIIQAAFLVGWALG